MVEHSPKILASEEKASTLWERCDVTSILVEHVVM